VKYIKYLHIVDNNSFSFFYKDSQFSAFLSASSSFFSY